MKSGQRQRATTMIELLVAVVFLAVCTSAILGCVWSTEGRSVYATHESVVLGYLKDSIETQRGIAHTAALTPSSFIVNVNLGIHQTVRVTTAVEVVTGYTDLFRVTVTATWPEQNFLGSRTDQMVLTTLVRAPDA